MCPLNARFLEHLEMRWRSYELDPDILTFDTLIDARG